MFEKEAELEEAKQREAELDERATMQKSVLLHALQQEIRRHDFNYFVHEPPSIAQGGKGECSCQNCGPGLTN
jgi:hypothetical protein